MAPRARFELATLRLTAEEVKNLNALSGVAYTMSGAILASLAAPNPAPKRFVCLVSVADWLELDASPGYRQGRMTFIPQIRGAPIEEIVLFLRELVIAVFSLAKRVCSFSFNLSMAVIFLPQLFNHCIYS